ncbi:hypothetical protein SADUNF_Sadunf02G0046700 [Salix dunnii]|uniref:Uncharacterized protein n=1 Tax=Salix dunnii TaxID=1413687 RepID=A0A835N6B5_9ROSI|nr:hypothetical protein SADUNF_Sadunf02G0046700 [Salix dunnii]
MARKSRAFLDYSALFQIVTSPFFLHYKVALVLPSIYTSPMVIVDSKKPGVSEMVIPNDQLVINSYKIHLAINFGELGFFGNIWGDGGPPLGYTGGTLNFHTIFNEFSLIRCSLSRLEIIRS